MMNEANAEFVVIQSELVEAIAKLDRLGGNEALEIARVALNELDGAISRYSDVHYPMPYKRPDEPVLEIVSAANRAAHALIAALTQSKMQSSEANA